MQPQVEVVVLDIVFAVTGGFSLREGDARALPPQRIAGEVERARQPTHICHRRTERRRDHRQRRYIDAAILVRWIFEADQRKNSVDLSEGKFLLISAWRLKNLEPLLRPQRATHRVLLLGGALVRIRLPR